MTKEMRGKIYSGIYKLLTKFSNCFSKLFTNNVVSNKTVTVRVSIIKDSPSGTNVYSEIHSKSTNVNGLCRKE